MAAFESKIATIAMRPGFEDVINELCAEGWEPYHVEHIDRTLWVFFKRRKLDQWPEQAPAEEPQPIG